MKVLLNTLQDYCATLPSAKQDIRDLLDDIGIEVKHIIDTPEGQVATVELLANRGDHHSYLGIAREISGKLNTAVIFPDCATLSFNQTPLQIAIETEHCFSYSLSRFLINPLNHINKKIQDTLKTADALTGIAVVDVANFVGIELGQPLHVFDADKVKGNIIVRLSQPGETAQLLFTDKPQAIPAGTIVICDEEKILALGGIIGCTSAEVTADTQHILVESALFDPVTIRSKAKSLKLQTQASVRFERGGDPAMVLKAVERIKYLLEQELGGKQAGDTLFLQKKSFTVPVILLSLAKVRHYFSTPLLPEEIKSRLNAYGFLVETENESHCSVQNHENPDDIVFAIQVPSNRIWDIKSPQCIYEELAKSIGYNQLPTEFPPNCLGALLPHRYNMQKHIAALLTRLGFYEVILDSFYGLADIAKLEPDKFQKLAEHVRIINSIDKSFSLLKNNGLLQALNLVAFNQCYGIHNVKIFEITQIFHPHKEQFCDQKSILWGLVNGHTEKHWDNQSTMLSVWYVKGIIEEIFHELSLPYQIKNGLSSHLISNKLHPKRQAAIYYDGRMIGIFGEVHPLVVDRFELKNKRPIYFEMETSIFERQVIDFESIKEPSEFLPIKRSLSFHVPRGIETASIVDTIEKAASACLEYAEVTDLYESKENETEIRAFTFELIFENNNKRSAQEINVALEQARAAVLHKFSSIGVVSR